MAKAWKRGQRLPAPSYPTAPVLFGIDWTEPNKLTPAQSAARDFHKDETRLKGQLARVYKVMADGKWRTIEEISHALNATGPVSHTGISARLRDLRKEKFGGYEVDRQHRGASSAGLYEYRLVI